MKFEVHILGSGSALPTISRNPTAHYVNIQERHLLIDCGEGTQLQLRKSKLKFQKIDHIFISHLHGDHYLGLIGLLSTFNLLGRKKTINIYAPEKLKELLDQHFIASQSYLGYLINFVPTAAKISEKIFEDNVFTVHTIPLKHKIPCTGFIIKEKQKLRKLKPAALKKHQIPIALFHQLKMGEDITLNNQRLNNDIFTLDPEKGRSYAFCSDTKYNQEMVPMINNVDLLYHEATFLEDKRDRADKTFHSTAHDAAKIAKLCNAKKLIIGHFSARYNDTSAFEKEAKLIFNNTVAINDGDCYEIDFIK